MCFSREIEFALYIEVPGECELVERFGDVHKTCILNKRKAGGSVQHSGGFMAPVGRAGTLHTAIVSPLGGIRRVV